MSLCSPPIAEAQDTVATTIEQLVESARVPWARWPDFAPYLDAVARVYPGPTPSPVWFDGLHLIAQSRTAVAALLAADTHGLDPGDYDADLLAEWARRSVRVPLAAVERAHFDVLLSVNLIRLLDDLRSGRLHRALLPSPTQIPARLDLGVALTEALAGDSLPRMIAAASPRLAQYQNLQRLLVQYRRLANDTLLRRFTSRTLLSTTPAEPLSAVRRLLAATGDLSPDSAADSAAGSMVQAIRRFQSRHGLPPTGRLDPSTIAELSTPFDHRVRQIELALERLRWLPPIGPQPFVVVNVPAFQLFAFDSVGGRGAPVLSMKVIVGKALDKRTPVLFEQMRYLEFRPTWNVPRTILMEEIMPQLRRDPDHLRRNRMELIGPRDRVIGSRVSAELLDSLERGELRVRQRPGGENPLGSVKFVFPNAANVYLHATPRTELFAHSRRDFSHGCIRVEDPTALAAWVLRDQPRWSRDSIIAAQKGKVTSRAMLTRPIPVVIFYTTAVATPMGGVWFFQDIYRHDQELDEALRGAPL